ncbi:glyoxylate/hydroxypyruvate reductase A-like [Penaeus monodon]|uniref:glyoxylate/hydroxypyruvate reductase A-like n=1 Tax=Penaeus monodon TaxID=6687 RepID=UPI0018A6D475|nr:glyoxylate/hydroxypyruvate reductase A-like [Penaeus monodon]
MASLKGVVHVLSFTPGMSASLRKRLPGVAVREVLREGTAEKHTGMPWLERDLFEDELEALRQAEVLLTDARTLLRVMDQAPNLRYVQIRSTGADFLTSQLQGRRPPFVVSRNTGAGVALLMAEYVVGAAICWERGFLEARDNQLKKVYDRGPRFALYRGIRDLTVAELVIAELMRFNLNSFPIYKVCHIQCILPVARVLKTFQCTVHGFSRTPQSESKRSPYIDVYWSTGQMESFLAECDYVVGVLPSTPTTKGLLGGDVLKAAKKCPILLNAGRGDLISEKDLLKALDAGWISGTILDVFETEPLPEDSLLWTHPKVFLTPHVSAFGSWKNRVESTLDCFVENYRRLQNGEPLLGVVDWSAGY